MTSSSSPTGLSQRGQTSSASVANSTAANTTARPMAPSRARDVCSSGKRHSASHKGRLPSVLSHTASTSSSVLGCQAVNVGDLAGVADEAAAGAGVR